MAGSSCLGCIFVQYQDNNQCGCLLRRAEKYGYKEISAKGGGSYWVTPDHICPAFRDKQWLGKNPRQPELAVREELFPKVQLFIIIREADDVERMTRLIQCANSYFAIDVIYYGSTQTMLFQYGSLLSRQGLFIHVASTPVEDQINYLFRQECQYYAVFDKPLYHKVCDIPNLLDQWINDQLHQVTLVKPTSGRLFDGAIMSSAMHKVLCGFGEQDIMEKISIYCTNHERDDLVLNEEQFYGPTTTP